MPTVNLPLPNRKALSTIQALKSPDGVSWSVVSHTLDPVKNEISVNIDVGDLVQLSTKLFAKQTKPSTNKPVYNSKKGLMGVRVSAFNAVSYGGLLTETFLGKVTTGSLANLYQNLTLESYVIDTVQNHLNSNVNYLTKHSQLTIAAANNNSPAVKVLPYQISNNGQGSIGYQANELTWKNLPTTATDIDGTVGQNIEQGKLYRVTAGKHVGLAIHCSVSANNVIMDAQLLGRDGKFYSISSGGEVTKFEVWDGSGWGDDGKIKITADGSDTFVDLNGNTNLQVVHELAIPYTWTSNRARSGPQVPGVDL